MLERPITPVRLRRQTGTVERTREPDDLLLPPVQSGSRISRGAAPPRVEMVTRPPRQSDSGSARALPSSQDDERFFRLPPTRPIEA